MGVLASSVAALALAEALGAGPGARRAAEGRLGAQQLLLQGDYQPPVVKKRRTRARKPRKPRKVTKVAAEFVPERLPDSAWDPDEYDPLEASRCRALLLEIMRRALHDWVLYRNHSNIDLRRKAEEAFTWLFEEKEGHPWWSLRKREGFMLTAFLVICECVDLEPEYVRRKAREMTVKQIMTSGRPAERRRVKKDVHYAEHGLDGGLDAESLDALDQSTEGFSSDVEAHFASYTPDYL